MGGTAGGDNPWFSPSIGAALVVHTETVRAFLQVSSSLQSANHIRQISLTHQIATDMAQELRQHAETQSQMEIAQAICMVSSAASSAAFCGGLGQGRPKPLPKLPNQPSTPQRTLETLNSVVTRNLEAAAPAWSSQTLKDTLEEMGQIMESAKLSASAEEV